MFDNVALSVFIGLVFVFLLYSLLATIIQEMIAGFINLRAVVLVKAIRVMLNDREPTTLKSKKSIGKFFERLNNQIKNQLHYLTCKLPDESFAKAFYKHPSIKYLSPSSLRSKPSYIEPGNFSSTIVKILRGMDYNGLNPQMQEIYKTLYPSDLQIKTIQDPTVVVGQVNSVTATIKPETLDQLRQLYVDAQKDVEKFKALLETWFNEIMDRANGWYKRQTKRILFIIGFVIAIWGNVDTLKIYSILAKDKTARDQMVQMAIQSQKKYEGTSTSNQVDVNTLNDELLNNTYAQVNDDAQKANDILSIGRITDEDSAIYKKLKIDLSNKVAEFNKLKSELIENETNLQRQINALKSSKDTSSKKALTLQLEKLKISDQEQLNPLRTQMLQLSSQLEKKEADLSFKHVDYFWSLIGWVITALAITLGAPFWFDLLNKFISIRAAGKTPEVDNVGDQTNSQTPNATLPNTQNIKVVEKVG
jgi:DNA-binding transcriptional regulator YbjK